MKAAIVRGHGGTQNVEIAEVPTPSPGPGEALVSVRAAALNHLDLWVLRGLPGLEPDFPHIGGSEMAGTVARLGAGVETFAVGDRVAINPGVWDETCEWCRKGEQSLCVSYRILGEHLDGGLAEYIAVPERNLLRIPNDLPFEDIAATPLVFQTAWRGLISRARLRAGQTILITGASGGVSTAAIQIARHAGATVFAVTSGAANVRRVEALGADVVFDRNEVDFSEETWKLTEKRGVDVVFDGVGEALWDGVIRALAKDGRLVTYGATTGYRGQIDIRRLFWKQLQIIGTTMASRSEFEHVMSLIFERKLVPVVDVVWPLDRVRDAYDRLAAGEHFGKVVLSVP